MDRFCLECKKPIPRTGYMAYYLKTKFCSVDCKQNYHQKIKNRSKSNSSKHTSLEPSSRKRNLNLSLDIEEYEILKKDKPEHLTWKEYFLKKARMGD